MATAAYTREAVYQELLGLARHSFLAYVVESSSPVVVDAADTKMMKLFQDLWEKERYYIERTYDLVDKAGIRPLPPTYSLKTSNFNFLRPMNLAEHWAPYVSDEIAKLPALKKRVGPDDPCANDFQRLVDDLLALRRESLRKVAELRAELAPKKDPAPAAVAAAPPAAAAAPPAAAKPAP